MVRWGEERVMLGVCECGGAAVAHEGPNANLDDVRKLCAMVVGRFHEGFAVGDERVLCWSL